MIVVRKILSTDTTDVLGDTELKVIPRDGTLEIFAASTQPDTNITIFKNDQIVVFNRPIQQRNNGMVDTIVDTPFEIQVLAGENVRVDIDINTSANVCVEANFRGIEEE